MAWVSLTGISLLLPVMLMVLKNKVEAKEILQRQKREWIIPPVNIPENEDYTHKDYIARIRTDAVPLSGKVLYSIHGNGADQDPLNVFIVNPYTGFIKVTNTLDREKIAMYNLTGIAKDTNGEILEKEIKLRIAVIDKNDCSPVFEEDKYAEVYELSETGTPVVRMTATDDDDPATDHTKIKYSIVSQSPPEPQIFSMNETTGMISVIKPYLDREQQSTYTLIVKGTDMDGKENGNTGTGTVHITVLDVNDHLPKLEKDEYSGSVDENTENVEVMRIKALDEDLEFSDNWMAEYDIVSGNEGGYFSFTTDTETNEGILMLNKALDYEVIQNLELSVAVRNKVVIHSRAAASFSSGTKTYPLKIHVKNQPEGPRFIPKVKAVSISEETKKVKLKSVITKYLAVNSDTGMTAERVRYAKAFDPDNWLSIDENTAEIKLNKLPDRESKFLVNGTYYAKVMVMTNDLPAKSATGTIALQVEDSNDHCPVLTSTSQVLCTESTAVFVTAEDEDADPNGPPFEFEIIPEGTKGTWIVEPLNDTTAILRTHDNLWPGSYEVAVEVKDQQGLSCPDKQVVKIDVCTCNEQKTCEATRKTTGAGLGFAAMGLLILGFLMLLFMALNLLFCSCGGLKGGADNEFVTEGQLMPYNTEEKGEDKEVPCLKAPLGPVLGILRVKTGEGAGLHRQGEIKKTFRDLAKRFEGSRTDNIHEEALSKEVLKKSQRSYSRFEDVCVDTALSEVFLKAYYSQKSKYAAEKALTVTDGVLVFDFEGRESPVGSVGCCSFIEGDDDLEFLNDLGPKFKTLAEICMGEEKKSELVVPPAMPTVQDVAVTRTEIKRENTVTTDAVRPQPSPVPQPQIQKNIVTEQYSSTTLPAMHLRENVVVPSPAYVILQPVYYTTTSVVQPTRYIVEPQVHNTMLFSERPAAPNVQGVLLVKEGPGSEKVLFQENRVVSGSAVQGRVLGYLHGNGSQNVVLVETKAGSGQFVQEGIAGLNQGAMHRVGLPGSQNVVLVERKAGSGQFVQEGIAGLNQGAMHRVGLPGSQNVVLVERKAGSGQVRGEISGKQSVMFTEKVV
ncbi:desmoglein-2.1-like isoform X3 [Lepisosteus oculatus]|uniref:desmoglein-2.1-like isoform X3 n=1 Tax=Lepisosteus oculatus TaxID=7918 RepID=UPI003717E882